MNKSKAIGTKAETATVKACRALGFPYADRHVQKGALDEGDVWLTPIGTPVAMVEVKGGEMARAASDNQIDLWLGEAVREKTNAGASVTMLVVQRRGVGEANAHRWWAFLSAGELARLLHYDAEDEREFDPIDYALGDVTVRMTLIEALQILRFAGYGDPL
jgi:hypothetical protein